MTDEVQKTGTEKGERIAKRLARAGVCSRRDAERLVAEGRVVVNGKVLESPAFNVQPRDKITVDGRPIRAAAETRLWLYHKPPGLVTTHRDEKGRPTIFDTLPRAMPRVISVGRLDLNSEGLLLLTNDGELSRRMELPSTGWARQYRVRAFGRVRENMFEKLAEGVTVDGVKYGPIEMEVEREQSTNTWFRMTLHEGKNREIRNVLGHFGLDVNRLIRIAYGPFQLGILERGAVEEVEPDAVAALSSKILPPA